MEHEYVCGDESIAKNGIPDSWWLEATRVADNVEKKKHSLELINTVSFQSPPLEILVSPLVYL